MSHDAIVQLLCYAQAELLPVRLTLRDGAEVVGTPTTIDVHPTAYEVFLEPHGDAATEIGISLTGITSAELL
jgi:hypothetical protein